jgi:hypothetical protein
MITGVVVKCSMLHEHFSATPEATGEEAWERGVPQGGGFSPASAGCSRWSVASRRSVMAWRHPTAREACTGAEARLATKEK